MLNKMAVTVGCMLAFAKAGGGHGGPPGLGPIGGGEYVAFTDFSSAGSPRLSYNTYNLGSSSSGGGGGGAYVAGAYGIGGYGSNSGGGAYVAGGYGGAAGGYGVGGLDIGRYGALALETSSAASSIGAYNSYAFAGPPAIGKLGRGKFGKGAIAIPQPETYQVEQYVSNEAQYTENEVNAYRRKKRYTVTHRPVYHKTVYNTYTAHDTVNKDVIHHLHESENRHFDVAGQEVYGGALEVDHGRKKGGFAAYQGHTAGYGKGGYAGGAIGGAGFVGGGAVIGGGAGIVNGGGPGAGFEFQQPGGLEFQQPSTLPANLGAPGRYPITDLGR